MAKRKVKQEQQDIASTSGSYIINSGINTTTTTSTIPAWSSGNTSFTGYSTTWTSSEIHIGKGKLIEENGDLIWVRPNGNKFNLTGKEAGFNKLYERLK